eukprot:g2577.t1
MNAKRDVSRLRSGIDLGLGGISSDSEETSNDEEHGEGEHNNVNTGKTQHETFHSNKFILDMKKIGYREQAALIQENLAQSSFDRGFMKSFKEAFQNNQSAGSELARQCLKNQQN